MSTVNRLKDRAVRIQKTVFLTEGADGFSWSTEQQTADDFVFILRPPNDNKSNALAGATYALMGKDHEEALMVAAAQATEKGRADLIAWRKANKRPARPDDEFQIDYTRLNTILQKNQLRFSMVSPTLEECGEFIVDVEEALLEAIQALFARVVTATPEDVMVAETFPAVEGEGIASDGGSVPAPDAGSVVADDDGGTSPVRVEPIDLPVRND